MDGATATRLPAASRTAPPSGPAASSARRSGSPSSGTSPLATASPTVRGPAPSRPTSSVAPSASPVADPGGTKDADAPGRWSKEVPDGAPGSTRASRSRPSASRTCPCPSGHGMEARARSGATNTASPVTSPHVKVARAARKAGRGSGSSAGGGGGSMDGGGGWPSADAAGAAGAVGRRVACQIRAAARARRMPPTAIAARIRPGGGVRRSFGTASGYQHLLLGSRPVAGPGAERPVGGPASPRSQGFRSWRPYTTLGALPPVEDNAGMDGPEGASAASPGPGPVVTGGRLVGTRIHPARIEAEFRAGNLREDGRTAAIVVGAWVLLSLPFIGVDLVWASPAGLLPQTLLARALYMLSGLAVVVLGLRARGPLGLDLAVLSTRRWVRRSRSSSRPAVRPTTTCRRCRTPSGSSSSSRGDPQPLQLPGARGGGGDRFLCGLDRRLPDSPALARRAPHRHHARHRQPGGRLRLLEAPPLPPPSVPRQPGGGGNHPEAPGERGTLPHRLRERVDRQGAHRSGRPVPEGEPRPLRILGYSADELVGRDVAAVTHPDDVAGSGQMPGRSSAASPTRA